MDGYLWRLLFGDKKFGNEIGMQVDPQTLANLIWNSGSHRYKWFVQNEDGSHQSCEILRIRLEQHALAVSGMHQFRDTSHVACDELDLVGKALENCVGWVVYGWGDYREQVGSREISHFSSWQPYKCGGVCGWRLGYDMASWCERSDMIEQFRNKLLHHLSISWCAIVVGSTNVVRPMNETFTFLSWCIWFINVPFVLSDDIY